MSHITSKPRNEGLERCSSGLLTMLQAAARTNSVSAARQRAALTPHYFQAYIPQVPPIARFEVWQVRLQTIWFRLKFTILSSSDRNQHGYLELRKHRRQYSM